MIRKVKVDSSTYADVPARYEAGTPAVADAVGLAAAAKYLSEFGLDVIHAHESICSITHSIGWPMFRR